MLALLTSTSPHSAGRGQLSSAAQRKRQLDRRPQLDPLILETAAASGPQVTRNHYLHEFFPHSTPYHRCDIDGKHCEPVKAESSRPRYTSQQAPRRQRLAEAANAAPQDEPEPVGENRRAAPIRSALPRRLSSAQSQDPSIVVPLLRSSESPSKRFTPLPPLTSPSHSKQALPSATKPARPSPLQVVCHARTRVPTPHGPVFLHLYRNNRDDKEHLAFVIDREQLDATPEHVSSAATSESWLRSRSLDAEWRAGETEMERIVRGAYVGRLGSGAGQAVASKPRPSTSAVDGDAADVYVPIVRIHSECFTGETLGSQRCDCGEQLDEALRIISSTPPYRGVVVYLRQEGRGIGLLSKLRAYNLQDLGHDTVTANLLLGHAADSRSYEVAAGILRDLGVQRLNLLTNNPDKVESVEGEGLAVVERVGMVPRQWTLASSGRRSRRHRDRTERAKRALRGIRHQAESAEGDRRAPGEDADAEDGEHHASPDDSDSGRSEQSVEEADDSEVEALKRRAGVGMIGGGTTRSAELDKYLRTKVERMRHLITLPAESDTDDASYRSGAASPSPLTQPPSRVPSGLGLASLRAKLRPLTPSRRPGRSRTLTQEAASSTGATSGSDGHGHGLERSNASLRTDPEGLSLGTDGSEDVSDDGLR